MEEELLTQRIAATDAAVITDNGVQCYILIFSITGAILYRVVKEKTIDTMHRTRFPEKFMGTRIHDYETVVYHYKKTKQKYAKSEKRSLRNRMDKYSYF